MRSRTTTRNPYKHTAYPAGTTKSEKAEARRKKAKAWRDVSNEFRNRVLSP